MIKRLEILLDEIAKEPLKRQGLSEKELEFLDMLGGLNTNAEDYQLYLHYIGRLNQIMNSKYKGR